MSLSRRTSKLNFLAVKYARSLFGNRAVSLGTACGRVCSLSYTHNRKVYSTNSSAHLQDLENFSPDMIRNFSIIAHIDHGKSTLADRLLELSGTIAKGNNKQVLDSLKVERERGITVKAQTCSMFYEWQGKTYLLNLIDTPGHSDFSYEVSRSLAACQGALLLVDATQGIQAQTIANFFLAFGEDLQIVPVINKVDLPSANVEKVKSQIESTFELDTTGVACISAKTGLNVTEIFPNIIEKIPSPVGDASKPFRALLFDTLYDKFAGVICLIAVKDGRLKKGEKLVSGHSNLVYDVQDLGLLYPTMKSASSLSAGQVGYLKMNLKSTREANIGDTFFKQGQEKGELFQGFRPAKSMVFAGLYPMDASKHSELQDALDRLTLNDASVTVAKETSSSLGQGFRLGFLGTLHMDVFRQRLEEEHATTVINTMPTVKYIVRFQDEEEREIRNPIDFPEGALLGKVKAFLEPVVFGTFVFPEEYLGKIISLCQNHRGEQLDCTYIDSNRVMLKYRLPMSEILTSFYDSLKSISSGFASFDYEEAGMEESDLVKVNILLNGKAVDALSCIAHRSHADRVAKSWVSKLKGVIDRQLFEISIQGQVSGRIVCRDTIKATRKDVTSKCYGGDITRKMKLLDKQKEAKKRMKRVAGGVELSQEAFLSLMTSGDN